MSTRMSQPTDNPIVDLEKRIIAKWSQENTFDKSLQQNIESPKWIFYDGPPFATGTPHYGHLLASTIKDIYGRYKTQQQHFVERRFGWDCHGLPIEYEINKQLGLTAQQALKKLGIYGYNQECRGIVQRYAGLWKHTIERVGRWVDMDNDYKTMDPEFMDSVWWVFKQLWDKDLIYQGTKVVPFSTALGTGLSNFEASSNYQSIQDPSVTVLMQSSDDPNLHFAVWTTTPWTLLSNVLVCVNPQKTYVTLQHNDSPQKIIIAKDTLERFEHHEQYSIIETNLGDKLVGLSYEPLFDHYANQRETHDIFKIVSDTYVTTEDGTGLVHQAPAFGEDDLRVAQANNITFHPCPIDDEGRFTDAIEWVKGLYFKDADKPIIQALKSKNLLHHHTVLEHSYPFCPRSDTPLIYKAIPSWFVKVTAIKDKLIRNCETINWQPSHIKDGRFGTWIKQARDWAISRSLSWGNPIPIWINDETGKIICISSREELSKYCKAKVHDLHREHIDAITFSIPGEAGIYHRIEDTLDCWFEAGAMPYAQQGYPYHTNKKIEDFFPADFITEGVDQTRGWFYTLNVLSTALFDQPAFKNAIVFGIILAKDGKKMSKRLKNYTQPDDLFNQYGADALRLYLVSSNLVKGEEQRFDNQGVQEVIKTILLPWLNAYKFFKTYADADQWKSDSHDQINSHDLDLWLVSKTQSLIKELTHHLDQYDLSSLLPQLHQFMDLLTNVYIRFNRQRFWTEDIDADKHSAYLTLGQTLSQLSQCLAPITPFMSDYTYGELSHYIKLSATSVHLDHYPTYDEQKIDLDLEEAVKNIYSVINLGRHLRTKADLKIKIPLQSLTIIAKDKRIHEHCQRFDSIIKRELNIKELLYTTDEASYVTVQTLPNSPVLGKRFGSQFGKIQRSIRELDAKAIEELEQQGKLELNGEIFEQSDILIKRKGMNDTVATDGMISVMIDTTLNETLISEGMAREVVNRIQRSRKALDLNITDRIHIQYQTDDHLNKAIESHQMYIQAETLTTALTNNQSSEEMDWIRHEIDDSVLNIYITVDK